MMLILFILFTKNYVKYKKIANSYKKLQQIKINKIMIQNQLIEKFKNIFNKIDSIQATIIIGSFGRNNPKANSDIDYQILVNEDFNKNIFLKEIKSSFSEELKHHLFLENKNKWCFFMTNDYIAIEVFVCDSLIKLDKYFLGSEIIKPENAIIFDKTNTVIQHFNNIIQKKQEEFNKIQENKIRHLIIEFQNRFEACSNAHARSDGYKFNVLFSHALNAVVRLIYLCEGANEHDYMPSNFLTKYSYKLNLEIEKLGTMDLMVANFHKRKLLDLFLKYLPVLIKNFNLKIDKNSTVNFLENVFKRDLFWNFRDIAKFNLKIKQGVIYRSSALCLYKKEPNLNIILEKYNIKTIIDLRAERELKECYYDKDQKTIYNIIHAPFNPWSQSIEFKNTYNAGTNTEIAYHFFLLECKESIKKVVETVIKSSGAINIHCHAGKDRTGIIVALFHLLSDVNQEDIFLDYLASEMDTNKSYLQILFKIVSEVGGIEKYLESCKLSKVQIKELKQKLCK
jgi:protein tyrosine/serine phosphatase/predicted nucleotidyltransferase